MSKHFLFFLISVIIFSCQEEVAEKKVSGAIYHWKTVYAPSTSSLKKLDTLNIQKQYIRFFDVDYNDAAKRALPKAIIEFKHKPRAQIVPVVFLTNRTFVKATLIESKALGELVVNKINSLAAAENLKFNELQLDCDWSNTTQEKYFVFLAAVKKATGPNVSLSATIRLHQIKFREKTGVPPVDTGTLMLYNTGDWTKRETNNSLFDPEVINQYLARVPDYPLPLNLALPIYSQTIIYRGNKFLTYRKGITYEELESNDALQKLELPNRFVCQKDSTFYEQSFRAGDVFRLETANFKTLNSVKDALLKMLNNKRVEVQLFHLEENALKRYSNIQLLELMTE